MLHVVPASLTPSFAWGSRGKMNARSLQTPSPFASAAPPAANSPLVVSRAIWVTAVAPRCSCPITDAISTPRGPAASSGRPHTALAATANRATGASTRAAFNEPCEVAPYPLGHMAVACHHE